MAQPFWDGTGGLADEAWNFVWLGGAFLAGISTVECPMTRSIEKKKTKGADGTTITDQGQELTPVSIRTEVYTPAQWEQWQEVLPLLWAAKAGGSRSPLEIVHPLPAVLGITAVYIEKINIKPPSNQVMVVEIAAFDWSPAVRALAVAAGSGKPAVKPAIVSPPQSSVKGTFQSTPSAPSKGTFEKTTYPTSAAPQPPAAPAAQNSSGWLNDWTGGLFGGGS